MTTQELWMILPIVIIGLSVLVTTITEITYNNLNRTISISLLFILMNESRVHNEVQNGI